MPLHRFSNRDRRPIRVEGWEHGLGVNGGSCSGTLWLAPADFALCKHWMSDVGATLTWEAFEKHCEHHKAISKASACLCREMQLMQICWCHGDRGPNQLRSHTAFERIWRELCAGGVVVCWCVHGQHGSPASLVLRELAWDICPASARHFGTAWLLQPCPLQVGSLACPQACASVRGESCAAKRCGGRRPRGERSASVDGESCTEPRSG